ncbi:glycine cleavage system H protein [Ancylostoma caninum]|uniref:Glycine cleavage system H protein n=2 Tax=Ancylostoma TaxID=29169 RepID=A0A368GU58_ANCCA|nr:glycine cleavage system H protein [Ancylostoma caninum]
MAMLMRSACATMRLAACVERAALQTRALSVSARLFAERKYTKKHEWVSVKGDIGTVGITDFATEQLGDIVFVELPDVGTELVQGDTTGAVESVKAASDIYAPVSGTVTEKNTVLESESGRINKSPFDEGWMYRLRLTNPKELSGLMDEQAYEKFKKEEEAEGH